MEITFNTLFRNKSLHQTAGVFIINSLLGIPAFFIPALIAYFYGVNSYTDSFFFSYTFIYFVISIFQAVISVLVVPFVVEKKDNRVALQIFVNSVYSYLGLVILAGIFCFYVFIFIFHNRISTELFTNIAVFLPVIFFVTLNSLSRGILNSVQKYYTAACSNGLSAVFVYVCVYFFNPYIGINSVMLGYLVGEICVFVVLFRSVLKIMGMRFHPLTASFEEVRVFLKSGVQQLAGSAFIASNPLVDKIFATSQPTGSVSILDYGQKVVTVMNSVFSSFLTVMLTKWSQDLVNDKYLKRKMMLYSLIAFFMSICIVLPGLAISRLAVQTLYPKVDTERLLLITQIFNISTIAILFIWPMQIAVRFAVVYRFTDVILKVAAFKFCSNVLLDLILVNVYGVIGISVSSLLNQFLGYLLMLYLFHKRYEKQIR